MKLCKEFPNPKLPYFWGGGGGHSQFTFKAYIHKMKSFEVTKGFDFILSSVSRKILPGSVSDDEFEK